MYGELLGQLLYVIDSRIRRGVTVPRTLALAVALYLAGPAVLGGVHARAQDFESERSSYDVYAEFLPGVSGPTYPRLGPAALDIGIGYTYAASIRNGRATGHGFQGQLGIHIPGLVWLDLALAGTYYQGSVTAGGDAGQYVGGTLRLGLWLFSALTALRNEWSMFNIFLGSEISMGEAIGAGTSSFTALPAPYVAFQAFIQCHFAIRVQARFSWTDIADQPAFGVYDIPTQLQAMLIFYMAREVRETFPRIDRFDHGQGSVCH